MLFKGDKDLTSSDSEINIAPPLSSRNKEPEKAEPPRAPSTVLETQACESTDLAHTLAS